MKILILSLKYNISLNSVDRILRKNIDSEEKSEYSKV